MGAFEDQQSALVRTPVTLAVLRLDYCGNTFGVSPCTATGEPCYNTFPTCKDRGNYLRTEKAYKFSDADAPPPFPGVRPYLVRHRDIPTEIRDTLAVRGRVVLEMLDEPEPTDVGIDPYVFDGTLNYTRQVNRSPGTYWKKILARNRNYAGRKLEIYKGFAGIAENEFALRWAGILDEITTDNGNAKIEAADPLQALRGVKIPEQIAVELLNDITSDQQSFVLTGVDLAKMPDSGACRIADEFIRYSAIDRNTNELSGVTRGAYGSAADAHDAGDALQPVVYIGPVNPFDLLLSLLTNAPDLRTNAPPGAGIDSASIDTAAFAFWRDWPSTDINLEGLLEDPTDLERLIFEVLETVDASMWYSERQKITVRRNIPNAPGRSIREVTDAAHIVGGSGKADGGEDERYTRIAVYWEPRRLKDQQKRSGYSRTEVAVDVDAESPNEYGAVKERAIPARLVTSASQQAETVEEFVASGAQRRLLRSREGSPTVTLEVEIKDADISTGDAVALTTDEVLDVAGNPISRAVGIVTKREDRGNTIRLNVRLYRGPRVGFISPDGHPDYAMATPTERDYGYVGDDIGLIETHHGYRIY